MRFFDNIEISLNTALPESNNDEEIFSLSCFKRNSKPAQRTTRPGIVQDLTQPSTWFRNTPWWLLCFRLLSSPRPPSFLRAALISKFSPYSNSVKKTHPSLSSAFCIQSGAESWIGLSLTIRVLVIPPRKWGLRPLSCSVTMVFLFNKTENCRCWTLSK